MNFAIGNALMDSIWQGSVIAGMLAGLLLVTRSPRVRYVAGCVAMLAIVAMFGMTLADQLAVKIAAHTIDPALTAWRTLPEWSGAKFADPALIPWLTPLWLVGVSILSVRHVAGFIILGRLRRQGAVLAEQRWSLLLQELARELGVTRAVELLESCRVQTPVLLGHFRPVILVPLGLLTKLPNSQLEAILCHELAHIRRFDYLVNNLQRFAESLLFYHPAVWWISHVIRTERENCCDDMVINLRGDAHGYAAALASLEEVRTPALAATGGNLVKRIRRLLQPQSASGVWSSILAIAILSTAATAVLAGWHQSADEWLNHDVVYIIDQQERAAFLRLTTDEERQKFIEQFWLRRDPTPGTPVNEFKEEHYRRISYANLHYQGASGREGWQTDRGHIYIVYGPPDEIDSHPDDVHPTETWGYNHVESLGDHIYLTFVDPDRSGEFKLLTGKTP